MSHHERDDSSKASLVPPTATRAAADDEGASGTGHFDDLLRAQAETEHESSERQLSEPYSDECAIERDGPDNNADGTSDGLEGDQDPCDLQDDH